MKRLLSHLLESFRKSRRGRSVVSRAASRKSSVRLEVEALEDRLLLCAPPPAGPGPVSLHARIVSEREVDLSWSGGVNATGFKVFQDGDLIKTLYDPHARSYAVKYLTPGNHLFEVGAFNNYGGSYGKGINVKFGQPGDVSATGELNVQLNAAYSGSDEELRGIVTSGAFPDNPLNRAFFIRLNNEVLCVEAALFSGSSANGGIIYWVVERGWDGVKTTPAPQEAQGSTFSFLYFKDLPPSPPPPPLPAAPQVVAQVVGEQIELTWKPVPGATDYVVTEVAADRIPATAGARTAASSQGQSPKDDSGTGSINVGTNTTFNSPDLLPGVTYCNTVTA